MKGKYHLSSNCYLSLVRKTYAYYFSFLLEDSFSKNICYYTFCNCKKNKKEKTGKIKGLNRI